MARLRPNHVVEPLVRRFSPSSRNWAAAMERHARAVAAGEPCYADPATARAVFTARFLAERGYCCDSGCRHCPYEH